MTTTLANLLLGVDMEGGESFCDSVYNFLKNQGKDINLFTNSGFGVWSQSDAAKGLASVPYNTGSEGGGDVPDVGDVALGATSGATGKIISYTITGGGFDTNNAAGVLTLGAVTGCFQTGETINFTDGETAIVGADADIGVKNDPCNNDSTGIWTTDGGLNLGFGAALYTVDTNAINLDAWITAGATLVAGKIYKIELDIKDGSVNTKGIRGYFDDGAAQYGKIETTGGAFVSVAWVFECATSTAAGKVGFRIVENLGGGGQNIQIRQFSCYEITPCCTNDADNKAFDTWYRDSTLDIYRQHWHATYSKCGSFYSLKMVPTLADDYVVFPLFTDVSDEEYWYKQFCGQPVTIGAWVLTNTASHAHVYIGDDVSGAQYSGYHTGDGDWEWLELTFVIDEAATRVLFGFYCAQAGDVDGSTIVYVSQPMLVFGWSLGEGMYQPRQQEWIWTEVGIDSNNLILASQSDTAWLDLNIEADSDGRIPKGCKSLQISCAINDSGSVGVTDDGKLRLRSGVVQGHYVYLSVAGLENDAVGRMTLRMPCDENGDIDYRFYATAGGTLDIPLFQYFAVQVN